MCTRRELESLIVLGLEEIKRLESSLDRRFAGLKSAPPQARASFLLNLAALSEKTRWMEQMIDALDEATHLAEPMSA